MSDVAVYIIANLVTHDKEEYLKYEKGFFPLLKKHGGSFITYDDEYQTPGRHRAQARSHNNISISLGVRCRDLVQRPGISSPL